MKPLHRRFTQWYNRRNARTGTIWEGRYKSVIVGGRGKRPADDGHFGSGLYLGATELWLVFQINGRRGGGEIEKFDVSVEESGGNEALVVRRVRLSRVPALDGRAEHHTGTAILCRSKMLQNLAEGGVYK